MNDTIKLKYLELFSKNNALSSSELYNLTDKSMSLVTIKRLLSGLKKNGYLESVGAGRSLKYKLTKKGLLLRPLDAAKYLEKDPDFRSLATKYDFSIFSEPVVALFTKEELKKLIKSTNDFHKLAERITQQERNKELLRFIVEFSWKTSKIEGNTYDLLSTEKLLVYGERSPKYSNQDAQMIVNQKLALEYVINNLDQFKSPSIILVEKIHSIIIGDLGIKKGLRQSLVGITGTNYLPLENIFQIKEALNDLFSYIKITENIYEKALLTVLGLSYIQPFSDGNKRTSRLIANALLLANGYAPISYRSVDEREYKEACLVFYEQNSIVEFKKLFIEQYIFAANNYNVSQ